MSVTGMARALSRSGVRTIIASLDYQEHGVSIEVGGCETILVTPTASGKMLRGWSPALAAAISRAASNGVDLIHNHALWMVPGIYARQTANRAKLPLVISPRGMLDPWSLRRSVVRKWVAGLLYEHRNLESARLLHATSDMEADGIREFGLAQPIAIIPNAVDVPSANEIPPRRLLEDRFPQLRDRRWLLFMGRIDPKKGLDMLLDAWRALGADFPEWELVIAGPDLVGYRNVLEQMLPVAGSPRKTVTFTAMLEGNFKNCALAHADAFVLPTRSENFGNTVAEALAFGTPVVTTTAAPWADLVAHDCGWWVKPETSSITAALEQALGQPAAHLKMMGIRGRRLVSEKYSWDAVGAQMASTYQWLLRGGAAPMWVRHS